MPAYPFTRTVGFGSLCKACGRQTEVLIDSDVAICPVCDNIP